MRLLLNICNRSNLQLIIIERKIKRSIVEIMYQSFNSEPTAPNQQYYAGGQGGYPPQGGYLPKGGYPPQGGYYPPPPAGGYAPPPAGGGYGDPEQQDVKNFSFDDQSIRKGFIRKVYLILMGQLLVTFGFVTLFVYHEPTKAWAFNNSWLFWVALAALFITMICMACCEGVRRQTPTNFIFLGLFTLAESFLMGVTSSQYESEGVMIAIGITAAVCLALSIFAMQTKYDFTMCGGVLLVAIVVFLIFGIVFLFFPSKLMTLVYSSCGALLFSFYLIYDTQLMMGGDHKYSISPEEYIFAALNLYLDIINIFMYILAIVGSRD